MLAPCKAKNELAGSQPANQNQIMAVKRTKEQAGTLVRGRPVVTTTMGTAFIACFLQRRFAAGDAQWNGSPAFLQASYRDAS
jgi:hypothetical protein